MEIKVKHGTFFISEEDFELISQYEWDIHQGMVRSKGRNSIGVHRLIMGLIKGDKREIDHKDHDGLNNRRENLRICTHKENSKNRSPWGRSKYLGVSFHNGTKKWMSRVVSNGKAFYLGIYDTEELAAQAYDKKSKELHGEFANLNFK